MPEVQHQARGRVGPYVPQFVSSNTVRVTRWGSTHRPTKAPRKHWELRFVQSPSCASQVFLISRHLPVKNEVHTGISITVSFSEFSSHYKILTSRLFI